MRTSSICPYTGMHPTFRTGEKFPSNSFSLVPIFTIPFITKLLRRGSQVPSQYMSAIKAYPNFYGSVQGLANRIQFICSESCCIWCQQCQAPEPPNPPNACSGFAKSHKRWLTSATSDFSVQSKIKVFFCELGTSVAFLCKHSDVTPLNLQIKPKEKVSERLRSKLTLSDATESSGCS